MKSGLISSPGKQEPDSIVLSGSLTLVSCSRKLFIIKFFYQAAKNNIHVA